MQDLFQWYYYLVLALKDPKKAKLLRLGPSRNDSNVIDSLLQGNLFQNRCFETPGTSDLHVYVSLFSEEISFLSKRHIKYNAIVALIDNLPYSERIKKGNRVIIYAFRNYREREKKKKKDTNNEEGMGENVNFHNKSSVEATDISAFYKIAADHFKVLSDVGFETYDASKMKNVRVYVHLRAFGGDLSSISSIMGHDGPKATHPCFYCSIPQSIDSNKKKGVITAIACGPEGQHLFHQLYDMQWYLNRIEPLLESHRQKSPYEEYTQLTPAERRDLSFRTYSDVVHLKSISFPHSFPFDPINVFFENITLMFYQISTGSSMDQIAEPNLKDFTFSKKEKEILLRMLDIVNDRFNSRTLKFSFPSEEIAAGKFEDVNAAQLEVLCYLMPIFHHQLQVANPSPEAYSLTLYLWDLFADFYYDENCKREIGQKSPFGWPRKMFRSPC